MKRIHLFESRFRSLIVEAMDINDIHTKYYSDIPYGDYVYIVKSADPTYDSVSGKMGKYAKWLLGMYRRGTFKAGDFGEANKLLTVFEKYKNRVQVRDVTQLHSMGELYQVVQPFMEGDQATSKSDLTRRAKQGAEKVYEDEFWIVIIPHTKEAAIQYGKNTKWCTAAEESSNMFDYYNNEGPLYININKETGDKYQFHFESQSFMDEMDWEIEQPVLETIGATDGLKEFYKEKAGLVNYINLVSDEFKIDESQLRLYNQFKAKKEETGNENIEYPNAYVVVAFNEKESEAYVNSEGEVISPWFYSCRPFMPYDKTKTTAVTADVSVVATRESSLYYDDYDLYGKVKYDVRTGEVYDYEWTDNYGNEVYPEFLESSDNYGQWYVNDVVEDEDDDYVSESRQHRLIIEAMDVKGIHTKYYSDIPYEDYINIVKTVDPTYNDATGKMGKYAKWLLGMYRRGTFKAGDFGEANKLLTVFEKYKNRVQVRDVTQLHSMRELYDVVQPFMEGDKATSKSDAIRRAKEDADKLYEDEKWIVIVPHTMEAAQLYGKHTKWCTAAEESDNMFDYYNEQGPLYINIDKENNRKYQFHFESDQFMDERDMNIDDPVFETIGATRGLMEFYKNHLELDLRGFLQMAYNYDLDEEQERVLNNRNGKDLPDAYLVWENTGNFCAYINGIGEVISPWFNDAAPFAGANYFGLPVAGVSINAWKGDYMTTIDGSVCYNERNGNVEVNEESWEDDGRPVNPYYVDYTNDEYGMWVVNEEDYESDEGEDEDYEDEEY